ncbi:Retrovirus-related Pol polyprotein from transposon TNT 1-94 [Vitis vinifera]|uniref:Retrovirus-related Pol polyprotein from transposon TNT 1-94 n=1 Tax=Vitis vinifera TaxID=29760 RepID=A0A438IAU9_VITVI|nr:Retrovirus-related Pol polyprotein from transposon TNT 1-94 [Vitis vinifera]
MDVKTTFLNGDLSEEVYMSQPKEFKANGKENMGLYMKVSGSKYIFMVLYIDDILLTSSDVNLLNDTKRILSTNFNMKDLREAYFMLGIEIYRDRSQNLLRLSQRAYINRVLKRLNMQTCKIGDVPIVKEDKLSNEQCPKIDLEKDAIKTIPYASVVGSLMYAQVFVFYSKNNKINTSSKDIEIKYLTVKDLVKKGDIVIEHIRTESMLADPLTKGLKPITFKEHVVNMGVIKSFDSLV